MSKDELHFRMRQRIVEVSNMKPERISPALAAVMEEASWTAIQHLVAEEEHSKLPPKG